MLIWILIFASKSSTHQLFLSLTPPRKCFFKNPNIFEGCLSYSYSVSHFAIRFLSASLCNLHAEFAFVSPGCSTLWQPAPFLWLPFGISSRLSQLQVWRASSTLLMVMHLSPQISPLSSSHLSSPEQSCKTISPLSPLLQIPHVHCHFTGVFRLLKVHCTHPSSQDATQTRLFSLQFVWSISSQFSCCYPLVFLLALLSCVSAHLKQLSVSRSENITSASLY